ncbi:MAG: response regulator transcription factor [Chloroflexi bacterium]|nr:response regulator transcription factor [Chloroflexota bacterium]
MNVVLADDHRLFREGLKALLTARGFAIVGEAGDAEEAVAVVRAARPEVVLMDLGMPHGGGLAATRRLKVELPSIPVIILTASEEEADLYEAVRSGAQGYLLKSLDPSTLVDLIHAAARGEPAMTPQLAAKILAEFARRGSAPGGPAEVAPVPAASRPSAPSPTAEPAGIEGDGLESLTAREREVLELLVGGKQNKEIAAQLVVSENTVKYHLKNILQKLHLHNRAQVVAYVLRHGV